jgi:dTDP-glucose pyrophosphorylase
VWPDGVVVIFPDREGIAGMGERSEQRLVEQLVTSLPLKLYGVISFHGDGEPIAIDEKPKNPRSN